MKKYSLLIVTIVFLLSGNKNYSYRPLLPECVGSSLEFDGVNDYVRIEHPFYNFSNEITVEWWANYDVVNSGGGSGIGQANADQDDGSSNVWLMHSWSERLDFYVNDNGTSSIATAPLKPGWHHWAGVANGNSVQLYMDGKKVGITGKGVTKIINVPTSVIDFGKDVRFSEGRWMKGKIDEVRVWNSALSQVTIQNWMNIPVNSLHSNYENLKGYWKLDEGNGNLVKDSSPLKRDGRVFNGSSWLPETKTCKKPPEISTFTLIDAESNKDLSRLKNNDTLNLAALPTTQLNIRANTKPNSYSIGSVVFTLNGTLYHKQIENITPYALLGNKNNDYLGSLVVKPGNYTLTATPYLGANGTGEKGTPLTVKFHVIYQVVNSITLINAATDQDIRTIQNGDVIDISTLSTSKLNIRANTSPYSVGSVVFNLNNWSTVQENDAPYAIGGNIKNNYRDWILPIGKHTLTATPYALKNATGQKGKAHTVTFTVVNSLDQARRFSVTQLRKRTDAASVKEMTNISAAPNPFLAQTTISFSVPESCYTTLDVYNLKGILVERLYEAQAEGQKTYQVSFKSKYITSGIYIVRLTNEKEVKSYKLVLLK
ncbi:LamG-like jellyroll fold domain-containing protein [Adhaeribacter radiodurans]|uniref:T9SS type A sorting domain-containing protein n=1 Tax=Adhaeribacter radiodurans TaxID=2745197 RepID=A0A7L7LCJ9_9BACT|nr:LamG-like jellyroll fold domain-containing protein [Adhaeribacter radiodurans]QMU30568.1 T9SS type A sorting domain-containing protein [Adhaeribacter radiodurans]